MSDDSGEWVDQCTYRHLMTTLQPGGDPTVLVVRALLTRPDAPKGGLGSFLPAYDVEGEPDLAPDSTGDYAIVLRGGDARVLARYPFTPRFSDDKGGPPLDVISVTYRVPLAPGLSTIELDGPGGKLLDARAYGAQAPVGELLTPRSGAKVGSGTRRIHVAWRTRSATGAPVVASLFYSADGGQLWQPQLLEQQRASFDVRLQPGGHHVIKLLVTDGSRSAQAIVAIRTTGSSHLLFFVLGGVGAALVVGGTVFAVRRRRIATD
jgi:LPXTG-motif cell wall-anchored protein